MEYKVYKEVKVNLELTQEEFNTLVISLGITTHADRQKSANIYGLEILTSHNDSHIFYEKLANVANSIDKPKK